MRESASRGFWVSSYAPFGYNRVMVQDGPKKRPTLEPDPDASRVVKRIFDLAEAGNGMTDITRTLNNEGISSPKGKLWGKTSVHTILINESYTGTLVWGTHSKDNAEPVRVEKAFPAIVTKAQFSRVNKLMATGRSAARTPRAAVCLLRLPVDHEARQGCLRHSQAQRPPLRGAGRRQHG